VRSEARGEYILGESAVDVSAPVSLVVLVFCPKASRIKESSSNPFVTKRATEQGSEFMHCGNELCRSRSQHTNLVEL
jgi:hypothetical protein